MQNIIDDDKALMTIVFDKKVLDYLKCKVNDYVGLFQSKSMDNFFILAKTDSGYRIKRYPLRKKTYQINVRYRYRGVPEFDFAACTYYLKRNGYVRIVAKY